LKKQHCYAHQESKNEHEQEKESYLTAGNRSRSLPPLKAKKQQVFLKI
jgi:hypothetical protein